MSSCWRRRHVCLLNKKARLLVEQEHMSSCAVSTQSACRSTQEAPKKHPGGTQEVPRSQFGGNIYVFMRVCCSKSDATKHFRVDGSDVTITGAWKLPSTYITLHLGCPSSGVISVCSYLCLSLDDGFAGRRGFHCFIGKSICCCVNGPHEQYIQIDIIVNYIFHLGLPGKCLQKSLETAPFWCRLCRR